MAHEAVLIFETESPIPFTVNNATGIEKGSLLKMTDPMTAIIHSGDEDQVCGIAAEEKIANDGKTTIGVYRRGIFDFYAAAGVTIGQAVAPSATANELKAADATCVNCKIVGIALSTAAGDNSLFRVDVDIGHTNNNIYA